MAPNWAQISKTISMPIPTANPLDRLRLVQWLSPSFPIGAFAYSQGLEQAITDGAVTSAETLENWVRATLAFGTGRMDAIFLAHGRASDADISALADLACAYASSAERMLEMMEQGRAFGRTIAAMTGVEQPALPYALAVGHATRDLQVPTEEVLQIWLHGLAAQQIAAAVKFVPLGQTSGQTVLANLGPEILALAQSCATAQLSALCNVSFGADMAQMRHETMDVRIFRS
jgi:urease accessory protein